MKFSVTIPTFKARYLAEAIQSIASQSYADWELIVVDDCSPEDIRSVVAPWFNDSRIRYYRNEKNCGSVNVVDNWNICLSYCTGDYVICIGDDDRLLPCCLEQYHDLILQHPGLNVYHAWSEIIDEHGQTISLQAPRPEWESVLSLIWNRWSTREKQFIGDFCYSVSYLKAAGGYFKLPLAWGSDDITATMAAKEKGIANTQQPGFQYRENSRSITSSTANARQKMLATLQQYDWFGQFLETIRETGTELSHADQTYLKTIAIPRQRYYYNSFGKNCRDYIKGNPVRLLWCYRQLQPLHFSLAAYAKWYLSSIYHLFA